MPNLNRIMLMGNLTRTPKLVDTSSGISMATFSLAINKKTKKGDETLFIDCVAFDKRADVISEYVKKGDPLYVEGELKIEEYTDKEDVTRKAVKVVVSNVVFLAKKSDSKKVETVKEDVPAKRTNKSRTLDDDIEDEIPF